MYPLISVIVNCHNGAKYLKSCIKSILNQKYKNLEIIFFDNYSSDNSKELINQFKDSRIKYHFSKKKLPLYKARNRAIKKSSGPLIAFLDIDDWWDPKYLSSKKNFFTNKDYDYFYTNVSIYHEKNKNFIKYNKFDLPSGIIFNSLAKNYFIIISGLIITKKILEKEKLFNEKYNIIGDYDFLMRISKYANAKSFNETLIFYRVHSDNFSKLNNKMYYYEYKDWYNCQKKINDDNFQKNKGNFLLQLSKLEIIHHLYQKKTLKLLIKIIKFPNFISKIKYLFAFVLPMKIVNHFRK